MSNELLEKPIEYEVNGEEVKLTGNMVKQFLVSGNETVTDQEIVMFLQLAKYQKLNPFLKEVYLVKFKGKPAQNIVAKEAFMKRAENHPQYNGLKAGIIVQRGDELVKLTGAVSLPTDKLIGGWAKVYRKDRPEPAEIEIELREFTKGQATWNQMPKNMIRKTAIVNALREAFPETLGAMYTEDDKLPIQDSGTPKNVTPDPEKTKAIEDKLFKQDDEASELVEEVAQESLDLNYPDPNAQNFDREDVTPNDEDGDDYPF
ncbi:phage recombination protein Bet [Enterococcus devriesei]|uniref:phage recombination protein Bet n=4 Tax=Enterococcus devriesei TaxID=319970 RepID=UPI003606838B